MRKSEVIIVCGYGCKIDLKHQEYLNRVIAYLRGKFIHLIVVSGGFSQRKTSPNKSEAMVMGSYLKSVTSRPIIEENESLTTNENLRNTYRLIKLDIRPNLHLIVIFCDAIRALKVKIIAEKVFKGYDIKIETFDLSPPGAAKRQLIASFADVLALYFPLIEVVRRKLRERRVQRI